MDANTWTYTPQRDLPAKVYDEQGCLIASIHNLDDDEANEIAALMAAAPRLLIIAQMAMTVAAGTPRPEELAELWEAAAKAIKATEVSV